MIRIPCQHHHGARAHVFFLADHPCNPVVGIIGEGFFRTFEPFIHAACGTARHGGGQVNQPTRVDGEPAHDLVGSQNKHRAWPSILSIVKSTPGTFRMTRGGIPVMLRAMNGLIEELDYCECPLGEIILRRRKILSLDGEIVYDVILNDEFLMCSLFHAAEDALADLGMDILAAPAADVVVGGLGLGYTAAAALRHTKVRSLAVVDFLEPVIRWHRDGLLPVDPQPAKDPRTTLVQADFFALAAAGNGFDPARPGAKAHAILLDIDHTHRHWLHPRHAAFYTRAGLSRLLDVLHPGGVFAMWADGLPDPEFVALLIDVFGTADGRTVRFANPHTGGESASTVYLAGGTLG